jgi:hypothetical protein
MSGTSTRQFGWGAWDIGPHPPMALGVEAAGVIVTVGDLPRRFSYSDEVMYSGSASVPGRLGRAARRPGNQPGAEAPRSAVGSGGRLSSANADRRAGPFRGVGLEEWRNLARPRGWRGNGRSDSPTRCLLRCHRVCHRGPPEGCSGPSKGRKAGPRLSAVRTGPIRCFRLYQEEFRPPSTRPQGVLPWLCERSAAAAAVATTTSDPPVPQRGISVSDVYIRSDGDHLRDLVTLRGQGHLSLTMAGSFSSLEAGRAWHES